MEGKEVVTAVVREGVIETLAHLSSPLGILDTTSEQLSSARSFYQEEISHHRPDSSLIR